MKLDGPESDAVSVSVEGPAFSRPAKVFAGLLVACLLYSSSQVASKHTVTELTVAGCAFVLFALACLLYTYYWILVSRTEINRELIRQTWCLNKCVRVSDITKVKFVCVPHFEWLIAPRIVVQVRGGGSCTFYAANQELLVAFARLSVGALA